MAVIDGRKKLIGELERSHKEVREFVATHFTRYLTHSDFRNALPGFTDNSARESIVVERIARLSAHAAKD